MNEFIYYIAYDDGNVIIRVNKATVAREFVIQRYDLNSKSWVNDFDMCGIYSGDIPVKSITEAEAQEIIKDGRYNKIG